MEGLIVNPVRKMVDDTKDAATRRQRDTTGDRPVIVERPEEVMEKIHQQASCLGPVMEEILRATQARGENRWGLNE